MNGLLADRCVEMHRLLDGFGRCLGAAHHFDQWDDVGRIERVADNDPFRVLAGRLNHTWRYARRARGDDRIEGRGFIDGREQLHLEVRSLGAVFLDEVDLRERLLRAFGEGSVATTSNPRAKY